MTRPSADTNDPDPPLLKRIEERWRWSSHSSDGSKSYRSLRIFRGGLLKSHMPSSARAGEATPRNDDCASSSNATIVPSLMSPPLLKVLSVARIRTNLIAVRGGFEEHLGADKNQDQDETGKDR